jgi:hypothetical protein
VSRRIFVALAALFGLGVLVASQLPHVWAWRADKLRYYPELVYAGTLPLYLDDAAADWALMRQVREGHVLLEDPFTADPHPRTYVNTLMLALGLASRLTGASVVTTYAASKLVFGAALLAILYALACRLFDKPAERLACFVMMAMTGGWEGPIAFLQRHLGVTWSASSPGWWMPEISTMFSLILFPHMVAGFAAMVAALLLMIRAWDPALSPATRRRGALAAGAVLFVLTLFHPYDTMTVLATMWTAPLVFKLAEKRPAQGTWAHTAMATAVTAPAIVYDLFLLRTNAAIRAWDLQNVMPTPTAGALAMCLGVNLLLALVVFPKWRTLPRPQLVMIAWVVSVAILIVLPLRFQRRMLGGVQLPLAALACTALAIVVVPLLFRRRLPTLALALALAPLYAVTACYVHQGQWRELRALKPPSWLGVERVRALEALSELAPDGSKVIASPANGLIVPALAGLTTFYGHPAMTIDAKVRKAEVARFYAGGPEDDAWRRDLLERWGIGYVLHTSEERALGSFDPGATPWLEAIFATGDDSARRAAIFKVR